MLNVYQIASFPAAWTRDHGFEFHWGYVCVYAYYFFLGGGGSLNIRVLRGTHPAVQEILSNTYKTRVKELLVFFWFLHRAVVDCSEGSEEHIPLPQLWLSSISSALSYNDTVFPCHLQGCWYVLSPTRKKTSYSDRRFWCSYILFIIIIGGILVLFT